MSYSKFKPQVWAQIIDRELKKNLVFGMLANRNYQGLIQNEGDSVKIPSISAVTIQDYTGADLTFSEDEGNEQIIQIDKAKAFAIVMDDVDKAQAVNGVMDLRTQNAVYRMADAVDTELAKLEAKVKKRVTCTLGTDKVSQKIIDLAVALDESNVPTTGRWLVISPATYGELIKEIPTISTGENTFEVNKTYYVGEWAGFSIYKSNNVVYDNSGKTYKNLAGITPGITLAMQLNKIDAGKFEKSFKEYVKGLNLFGCDVLETDLSGHKTEYLAAFDVVMP